MAIKTAFLVFLLVLPTCYAVDYTVGDTNGWTQGVNYASWTSGKTFNVGDRLVFTYGGSHSVDVVSKSDYDNCATGNALQSYSNGNTAIPLNSTGSMYFVCPTIGHCSGGMKLAVTVSSGTPTPGGATPRPSTPGGATPSPSKPSGASSNLFNIYFMGLAACVMYAFMG